MLENKLPRGALATLDSFPEGFESLARDGLATCRDDRTKARLAYELGYYLLIANPDGLGDDAEALERLQEAETLAASVGDDVLARDAWRLRVQRPHRQIRLRQLKDSREIAALAVQEWENTLAQIAACRDSADREGAGQTVALAGETALGFALTYCAAISRNPETDVDATCPLAYLVDEARKHVDDFSGVCDATRERLHRFIRRGERTLALIAGGF